MLFIYFDLYFILEQSDALKFTVAGRLQNKNNDKTPIELPFERGITKDGESVSKKCPLEIIRSASDITEQKIEKNNYKDNKLTLKSNELSSVFDSNTDEQDIDEHDNIFINDKDNNFYNNNGKEKKDGRVVEVPRFDDQETFCKFFGTIKTPEDVVLDDSKKSITSDEKTSSLPQTLQEFDDAIKPTEKLANRRNIKVPRKSKRIINYNPVKSLLARADINWKYTENNGTPFISAQKIAEPTPCK